MDSTSSGSARPLQKSRASSSSSTSKTVIQQQQEASTSVSYPIITSSISSPIASESTLPWHLNSPNGSSPGLSFIASSSLNASSFLPPKKLSISPYQRQRTSLIGSSFQSSSTGSLVAPAEVTLVENTLKLESLGVSTSRPDPISAPKVTLSSRCRPDPKVVFDQTYFKGEGGRNATRRSRRSQTTISNTERRESLAGIGEEEGESSLHSSIVSFPSGESSITSTRNTNTLTSPTSTSSNLPTNTSATSFIPDADSQSATSTSSSIPTTSKKLAWSTPKSWAEMASSRDSNGFGTSTSLGAPFSENINARHSGNHSPSHSISYPNSTEASPFTLDARRQGPNGKVKKNSDVPAGLEDVIRQAEGRFLAPLTYPRGMINKGNLCFANAILQVLVYCAPFYNLFRLVGEHVAHDFHNSTPLMEAVIHFLSEFHPIPKSTQKALQETPAKAIDLLREIEASSEPFAPEFLYEAMKLNKRFDTMRRGHQEDAEEFLGFFLDTLHEELLIAIRTSNDKLATKTNGLVHSSEAGKIELDQGEIDGGDLEREVKRPVSPTEGDGWLEVGQKGKTSFTRTTSSAHSPITRIFGGKLRSILRIPGSKDSVTLEPYQPLQLDIQPSQVTTVEEALENLTIPETITGLLSASTKAPVDATKQVFIETLPPILILHMKRFVYDDIGGVQKSSKVLGYGPTLEISESVISPARRAEAKRRYKLFGVVYHHGRYASGGHYTVDVLKQDQSEWLHIDDTTWSVVSTPSVRAGSEIGGIKQHHDGVAYLLFYAREDVVPSLPNGINTTSSNGDVSASPRPNSVSSPHLGKGALPFLSSAHRRVASTTSQRSQGSKK